MTDRVGLVVCEQARIYDHGPGHPLRPQRVLLTWELLRAYGVEALPVVERLGCEEADDDTIALVHDPGVHRGDAEGRPGRGRGLGALRLRTRRQSDLRSDA